MGILAYFSTPLYTGGSSTSLVPHVYDVAVAGRGYMLDRARLGDQPMISSIRAIRAQSDGSNEPGDQSVNTEDLWRRPVDSWHLGAGQDYLDRSDSKRARFRTSKGIDPWTKGQISLLPDTDQKLSSASTNLQLMPAGSRVYVSDDTALKFATDLSADSPTWTTVTGTSGSAITCLASDGFYVWITDGANVYRTNTGVSTASSWSTTDADLLGYVKGRLMYADGNVLGYFSDMTTPTATVLFTHATTSFTWVGFAEGPGHIYAAGYAGDKSLIYRVGITREGTSLDAPIVAGELPDGEVIHSIGSYLGFIFLGTSSGVRFCTIDGQGNLTIGQLLETGNPVKCFEGQGEFVWFGWTNYDGTSTGLGRLSLRDFADIGALAPAYTSDLMVTAQAAVLSVCTFAGKRVFSASGQGVYAEDTPLVASGTIDQGRVNFGISEKKIPLFLDVTFASSFAGTVTAYYAVDGASSYTSVGSQTTSSIDETTAVFSISEDPCDQIETRLVLARGSDTSTGPTVLRATLRAQPVPQMRSRIILPLLLVENAEGANRTVLHFDPAFEHDAIEGWRTSKQVVLVQVGDQQYSAVVDDFDFFPTHPTKDRAFWNGTCLTQFKTV